MILPFWNCIIPSKHSFSVIYERRSYHHPTSTWIRLHLWSIDPILFSAFDSAFTWNSDSLSSLHAFMHNLLRPERLLINCTPDLLIVVPYDQFPDPISGWRSSTANAIELLFTNMIAIFSFYNNVFAWTKQSILPIVFVPNWVSMSHPKSCSWPIGLERRKRFLSLEAIAIDRLFVQTSLALASICPPLLSSTSVSIHLRGSCWTNGPFSGFIDLVRPESPVWHAHTCARY